MQGVIRNRQVPACRTPLWSKLDFQKMHQQTHSAASQFPSGAGGHAVQFVGNLLEFFLIQSLPSAQQFRTPNS